jgi:hypothetical protein
MFEAGNHAARTLRSWTSCGFGGNRSAKLACIAVLRMVQAKDDAIPLAGEKWTSYQAGMETRLLSATTEGRGSRNLQL